MRNCVNCNKELNEKQEKYCSVKCSNKDTNKVHLSMEAQAQRYKERKLHLIKLQGGCCTKCGYNKNLAGLCFHHIDPSSKEFELNSRELSNRSIKNLEEEASKCLLLCHNCHMEEHWPSLDMTMLQLKDTTLKHPKKQDTKILWPSDEELSAMLWSKPMKEVAKALGVSSSRISVYTTKRNISKPPKNYWANKSELRKKK